MATTITTSADGRNIKAAVPAGETSTPIMVGQLVTIVCSPGAGGTMLAEATWSSRDDVNANTARWLSWDAGTTSSRIAQRLAEATAVRFTATGAAGVGEVAR